MPEVEAASPAGSAFERAPSFEDSGAFELGGGGDVSRQNQAFLELLGDMEARFPVDRWVIDGVHVWPVVRMHLYYSFFDFQFFAVEPVRAGLITPPDITRLAGRVIGSLWRFVEASISDWRNRQHIDTPCDVVFLNYNTYMTLLDGTWYSRICDPFVGPLSKRGLSSLMLTGGYEYAVPRFTKSAFIQPRLVLHRVLGMLSRKRGHDVLGELADLERYAKASNLFAESFTLTEPVERHLRQIRGIASYFRRVLKVTRPQVVFVTCCYGTESMACILACRELAIPTVDIQHGSQGHSHVAYGRWNRVPSTGYELLPTVFWCWGKSEATAIREWSRSLPIHQPIVGGNLFLERWLAGSDDTVHAYDKLIVDMKGRHKEKFHVLFTLNGNTRDELRAMVDIIAAVNKSDLVCFFWVRLHPVTLAQKDSVLEVLRDHSITNVDVENATVLPLYAILRHVDVHITEHSSVVMEAESFGVPSVIGELGALSFASQISSGWAVQAHSTLEWVEGIRCQLERRSSIVDRNRPSADPAEQALDELLDRLSVTTGRTK